jgi:hypothetical protein
MITRKCYKIENINEAYEKQNPRNCPVMEYTADGDYVGVCCFYLKDGKTCPRHGVVKPDTGVFVAEGVKHK